MTEKQNGYLQSGHLKLRVSCVSVNVQIFNTTISSLLQQARLMKTLNSVTPFSGDGL